MHYEIYSHNSIHKHTKNQFIKHILFQILFNRQILYPFLLAVTEGTPRRVVKVVVRPVFVQRLFVQGVFVQFYRLGKIRLG